jgi:hypothetical protein
MIIKTELLEYLTRQCVREVLDQLEEEANVSKLKSSGIGKGDDVKPVKQTITGKSAKIGNKKKVNITELDESGVAPNKISEFSEPCGCGHPESSHHNWNGQCKACKCAHFFNPGQMSEEDDPTKGDLAPSQDDQGTGGQPPISKEEPTPEEPKPEETPPQRIPKGAVVLNPEDKSKLQPIKWQGKDEAAIERTLHQVAVSMAGPRTKVSIGAKRLAREVMTNPNSTVFFFFGRTDPESEVFLMGDKSLQVAKNDSVQPGELVNTPVSPINQTVNYSGPKDYDDEYIARMGSMTDAQYANYTNNRYTAKPQGINEGVTKLIKKMVNKILDS